MSTDKTNNHNDDAPATSDLRKAIADTAALTVGYYMELQRLGLSKEEAMSLTIGFQRAAVNANRPPQDDEAA